MVCSLQALVDRLRPAPADARGAHWQQAKLVVAIERFAARHPEVLAPPPQLVAMDAEEMGL